MHKLALPLAAAALTLTACSSEEASTTAPATGAPATTAPATTAPAAPAQPAMPAQAAAAPAPGPAPAQGAGAQLKVADVFAQKDTLAGKLVSLSGKVVKFNANIMGSNWIHVQDGSGADGTNDITITTKAVVAVGDTVAVTGAVTRNKDFGAGYKFDVIIENARVDKQ